MGKPVRPVNYRLIAPEQSFIGRYMSHMHGQETPFAYDFWTACWLLSVALGRDATIPRPRAPIHMNLYAILLADSGVTRKSSAVREATKIVHGFINAQKSNETLLIESKMSPERLEDVLHTQTEKYGHASAAISISELVTFFGKERYTLAMPGLLTDLYDCPSSRVGGGSIRRGASSIKNVYLSFLSASTPAWLARAINPDVIEGGFTSRCIFITSEKRKRHIAWPEEQEDTTQWFIDEMVRIRERTDEFNEIELSPGALKVYTAWYNRKEYSADPFSVSFESREDAHMLRLAGYLAVSSGAWQIQHHDVKNAIKIIREIKRDAASIFIGGQRPDKLAAGIDYLRVKLADAGLDGIHNRQLYHSVRYYLSKDEYYTVLEIMQELEMVDCFILNPPHHRGPKPKVWRATKNILTPSINARLKEMMTNH